MKRRKHGRRRARARARIERQLEVPSCMASCYEQTIVFLAMREAALDAGGDRADPTAQ